MIDFPQKPVAAIVDSCLKTSTERSTLIGISGIDASGKGYITAALDQELTSAGYTTAVINVDGWLNLPHVRFDPQDLATNFYCNAIRFEEMFSQLVLPLCDKRSVEITVDFTEEIATEYHRNRYAFNEVDVILLEGIFLFKRELALHFDLRIWIDCPFDIALTRAVARSQEGLSPAETIGAYETIYFPAQRIHFDRDDPRSAADIVIDNH